MDEIILSSGSDSDSEIEIIFSKPSQEIIILENDSKRRCVEKKKSSYFVSESSRIPNSPKRKIHESPAKPKIIEICSVKSIKKCDRSIQEYFLSLLNKSYVIKNLKYDEYLDASFSDELFLKFSCWENCKNTHYLTLFLPWMKIASKKSIDLSELLNLLENFFSYGTNLGQRWSDNACFCEFLIKFSQCIKKISVKKDNFDKNKNPSQKNMTQLSSITLKINQLFSKMIKSVRRSNFKMFLTFYKITFDIYIVYSLYLFDVKRKFKNDPFSLIKFFNPDDKFLFELMDHFKCSVLFFENNIELFKSIHFALYCEITQSILFTNLLFYEKQSIKKHTNELLNTLEKIYSKLSSAEAKSVFRHQILYHDEIKIKFFHLQLSANKPTLEDQTDYLNFLEEFLIVFRRLEPNLEKNPFIACLFDIDDCSSNKQRIIELFYEVYLIRNLDEKTSLDLKNLFTHLF